MTDKNALLCAVTTSLAWGLTGIFVRLLPSISPWSIAAGRLVIRTIWGEPPSRNEIYGAMLAVSGIAVILSPKMSFSGEPSHTHLWGNVIAVCASASSAFYAYTYRVLAEQKRAPETSGVSLLTFAMGGSILVTAVSLSPSSSGLAELQNGDQFVFLALGVLSTAVPTRGFAAPAKRLPAIMTATSSLFIPVFSGAFAYLILGERLSTLFLAGCVLVLWGVSMIIRSQRTGNRQLSHTAE